MSRNPNLTPLPGSCAACTVRPFALFRVIPQARVGEIARIRSGVRLVRSGDAILDAVFTMYAGWAFTWTATPDGRRQVLDFHLPGDLVERSEDAAEVEALTDASFCILSKERLCAFMGHDPGLALSYVEGLTRDRARMRERLTSLGRRDAAGRVAHLLLELHGRLLRRGGADARGAAVPLKQAHLADALGLSVEHANRALASMRKEGIATLNKGRLEIQDRRAMEDLAGWAGTAHAGTTLAPRTLVG
ncbi:Crp/Fnr family transcriptional regulator [Falsiroseomonas tokyonensis]|uniref:Crp/Fnr family transcriptional regulator n=1 Tax=Falsiroseomonas tokyonensis TaxID=430521 RepID=A0ABV7BLC7_9PROT|nr:Crp/Fnr family transcriptional regulator [Falsiroseomonas tokyonensis]MBU8536396.1 Crp/Fnr family transcriptional regulator [Falsiroseomonas tokyonensis]